MGVPKSEPADESNRKPRNDVYFHSGAILLVQIATAGDEQPLVGSVHNGLQQGWVNQEQPQTRQRMNELFGEDDP